MKRLFFLVVALSLLGVSFSSVSSASAQVYVTYQPTDIVECRGTYTQAAINAGDSLLLTNSPVYKYEMRASAVGMHSAVYGDLMTTSNLVVDGTLNLSEIIFQNTSSASITVSMCRALALTPTITATSSPLPPGCYVLDIQSPQFISVAAGATITLVSGVVEYGGSFGLSWSPIVGTLYIPFIGSAYLRGSGVVRVCNPQFATATPTSGTGSPSTDICGPGDILYNNYYVVPFVRSTNNPPISYISLTIPAQYASVRVGLSLPSISNFFRQYTSGSGFGAYNLFPPSSNGPSFAIFPWPAGAFARSGTIPTGRVVTFEWHTDAGTLAAVNDPGTQRVCITGILVSSP